MNTIALSVKRVNLYEVITLEISTFVFGFFKGLAGLPILLFRWIVGLFFIITLGTLSVVILYFPILVMRKTVKKHMRFLLANLNNISQRDAMEVYSELKKMKEKAVTVVQDTTPFFVFLPITHEFKKMNDNFQEAETAIYNKAYPNRGKSLTSQEREKLTDIFKAWEEDWSDEKMDVYNN